MLRSSVHFPLRLRLVRSVGAIGRLAGLLLAVCLVAGPFASARAAELDPAELEALRALVERLEGRVEALEREGRDRDAALASTEAELATQKAELDEARDALATAEARLADQSSMIRGLSNGGGAGTSLGRFLESIEVSGAIAPSYNWNFNNPDSEPSVGHPIGSGNDNNGPVYPQVKHNTFQLDQARLAIGRRASEVDRAGFRLEMLYGVSADPGGGSDAPVVQQAWVSWRAPFGRDVEVVFGRWDSPIGAEVIYVGENINVSRGLIWRQQPWNHDGLIVSGGLPAGFSWKLGVANNDYAENFDNNDAKSVLAQVGWSDGPFRLRLNYMLADGPERGPFRAQSSQANEDLQHMLDFVAFWDPNERISVWLNLDWIRTDFDDIDPSVFYGAALAGRVGVTEKTGIALRAEWAGRRFGKGQPENVDAFWLTGTVDHALTASLSLRGEIAWYGAFRDGGPDEFFINGAGTADTKRQQTVAILQAIYFF